MDDPEIVARKDEFLQRRDADRPTPGEATPAVRSGRR
jgi:hypothetical protein